MKNRNGILKAAMFAALCLAQGVWAQVWNGTIDSEWYWDNTSQAEFTITKAEQLAGLAQLVNGGNNFSGKTIKLGANIVLNDTANWPKWNETKPTNTWTPIGSYTDENNNRPFSGIFDGGGYVVSGVYINNSNDYQGLFGYAGSSATIKNLGVTASYVEGNNYVSGLVGFNYGTITDCYARTGNVNGNTVGGLVGYNGGTITNCYATGDVYKKDVNKDGGYDNGNIGGLVGYNKGTITNCYATGDVDGSVTHGLVGITVGGLVGFNYGTITDCYATGNVKGSAYSNTVGSLVGYNKGGTITDCYAMGNVSGNTAGGLVGTNEGGTITNCYAMGYVKGNSDYSAGGLIGTNEGGAITNCYATGNVNGSTAGGLVGTNEGGTITDCYAAGNVSGSTAGGLMGRSKGGTIKDCYAIGNVNGNAAGGLVGSNGGTITNCYATGNVQGKEDIGGLVGSNTGIITDCYAIADVQGNNNVGGLVGENNKGDRDSSETITNCYSAGKVSGTTGNTIGGLMGKNEGTIKNSYYDRQASGQSDIVRGEPKSTAQMKQQETFANWDFDKIWRVNADKNNGYPHLQFSESKTDTVKYKYPRNVQEGKVLTDKRDSKKYKTVIIGMQTWMAENLNYSAKGSKCYDNKPANCKEYGMLYNWVTALKACPVGWHLPTNAEWEELYRYADLYADNEAGKYLKAKSGWNSNGSGTDEFGFSALPGGIGDKGSSGFFNVGNRGYWWSASERSSSSAYGREMHYNSGIAYWNNYDDGKSLLFSVRCVQD